jgi:hypothetical protein
LFVICNLENLGFREAFFRKRFDKTLFSLYISFTMDTNQLEEQQPVSSPLSSGQMSRLSSKKDKKAVGLVLLLIALVLVGGGVFYFLSLRNKQESKIESPTRTELPMIVEEKSIPTSTPTATPVEVVDKKLVSIQVLNGTGIVGEAAYLQDKLNSLGYTSVKIGNAPKQNYESTQVTFSSKLSYSVVSEITKELEKIYQKVETKKSSSTSYDVEIITGLRSGQTPKASTTPKPTSTAKPTSTPTAKPTSSPTPTTSL